MKKTAVNEPLLRILVSVYNQSIQTYHHFPEVILCGRQRLAPEEFSDLLANGFLTPIGSDSFGRNYCLSKKGEAFLFGASFRRRHKTVPGSEPAQRKFPFAETCNA